MNETDTCVCFKEKLFLRNLQQQQQQQRQLYNNIQKICTIINVSIYIQCYLHAIAIGMLDLGRSGVHILRLKLSFRERLFKKFSQRV